ncbi:MAG: hypothetical protein NTZ34_06360, partial [Chloroflexi bacterium]|nr:hypothetical protein [Chloroflexota bacterium]
NTDKQKYVDNIFNCMDYAVMLQNNATKAGWITAFVGISLRDNGTDNVSGHAINAFQTIDYGKVYIDCTRSAGETAYDIDKLVTVDIGKPYEATYIFPSKYYPMFLHYNSNQTVQTIRLEQWPLTQW